MGIHDSYGKSLLAEILGNRWANWFSETERSAAFGSVAAELDGIIRTADLSAIECAVEIEATNFKQIRGALVGLAKHTAPKKLFVVIKAQPEVSRRSDQEIRDHCAQAWAMLANQASDFKLVVLSGTGHTHASDMDKELLRSALCDLKVI